MTCYALCLVPPKLDPGDTHTHISASGAGGNREGSGGPKVAQLVKHVEKRRVAPTNVPKRVEKQKQQQPMRSSDRKLLYSRSYHQTLCAAKRDARAPSGRASRATSSNPRRCWTRRQRWPLLRRVPAASSPSPPTPTTRTPACKRRPPRQHERLRAKEQQSQKRLSNETCGRKCAHTITPHDRTLCSEAVHTNHAMRQRTVNATSDCG